MLAQKILDIPFVHRNNALRTFFTAAWLGWQIESNWADPFLFAIYSIARPLASVSILVVMYSVISDASFKEPIFAYMYLGNALYILVSQVMTGVSWVIIDDREHYRTMKQLHTTPMHYYFYLLGRGTSRLILGSISLLITVGVGLVAFSLPIHLGEMNIPLLIVTMALGLIAIACMGLILGVLTLMMARHFWSIGEAVAGALYLFTGAIFPIEILPNWLQPVGFIFPVTYWLELSRRAILGDEMVSFTTFEDFSNWELLGILSVMTLALVAASARIYSWALHRARFLGMIDIETSY